MFRLLVHVGTRGSTKQSYQQVRCLFDFVGSKKVPPVHEAIKDVAIAPIESFEERQENFIPLTRRSLFRYISQEKKLLRPDEREAFEDFSVALDNIIARRYQEQLHELKNLFDPINPDKDTQETRAWSRRQRLDTEFWLLERLSDLIEEANFRELTRAEVEHALKEHNTRHGVTVSVDLAQYDVLKLWVLGREEAARPRGLLRRLVDALSQTRRPPGLPGEEHVGMYKRVLLAVRMKREDKLALKLFKDIPEDALEQLLPEGRLSMSNLDKVLLRSTVALGGAGVALFGATWWAGVALPWSLLVSGVAAAVAGRCWAVTASRRRLYLSRLNQLLYWHNVANNRGLLTLVADRAQEEAFKEALLAFVFLHAARGDADTSLAVLEARVEAWLARRCLVGGVRFEATGAVELLHSLGVVASEDSHLRVVAPSLSDVVARLPVEPRAMALLRASPTEDEAFDGPSGRQVAGKGSGPGWK